MHLYNGNNVVAHLQNSSAYWYLDWRCAGSQSQAVFVEISWSYSGSTCLSFRSMIKFVYFAKILYSSK
jgi:hypothetical protein